ncbi:endolytic transglycosylase MltG [Nonomuraea sp. NPDC049400]|uniref:endolytic transglycosylase MltG n=1 Tax=Nonomuraea sp. NPDC049400 TaxID=3364352 RepID=UPI0037A27673
MNGTPENGTPEDEDDLGDVIPFAADDSTPEEYESPQAAPEAEPEAVSEAQAVHEAQAVSEAGTVPEAEAGPKADPVHEAGTAQEAQAAREGEIAPEADAVHEAGTAPEAGTVRGGGIAPEAEAAREGGIAPEVGTVPAAEVVSPSGRRRQALRKAGIVSAGLVVSLVAMGAGMIAVVKPYLSPDDFDGPGGGVVTVRIAPGASAEDIGSTLAEAGVVASARSFVRAAEERAVTNRLRPGHYRLRKGMAAGAALDLLLAPASRVVRRVTIPEGMRTSEVLARVAKQTGLPLKELQSVDKGLVGLPKYAAGLEGFLFPATYEIEPGDTAVDVLAAMVERFGVAARQVGLEAQAARRHLTPLEAVTVASMIQAEGGTDADYPKISRVIYNRLQKDTKLEIDSTVLYAQNRRTLRITERDTKVDSPYNTYRHKGLPPGPIANPGEKALIAALNPAKGDWHWFVTTDPAHRITKFTNKESEFVRYREELKKNLGTN